MLRFCVSKSTICASKFTHSLEFRASMDAMSDTLWIQRWKYSWKTRPCLFSSYWRLSNFLKFFTHFFLLLVEADFMGPCLGNLAFFQGELETKCFTCWKQDGDVETVTAKQRWTLTKTTVFQSKNFTTFQNTGTSNLACKGQVSIIFLSWRTQRPGGLR